MKIDIEGYGDWQQLRVIDAKNYPSIKIAYDPGTRWFQSLLEHNSKVATLRINGIVDDYVIEFDDHPMCAVGQIMYFMLNISKA